MQEILDLIDGLKFFEFAPAFNPFPRERNLKFQVERTVGRTERNDAKDANTKADLEQSRLPLVEAWY